MTIAAFRLVASRAAPVSDDEIIPISIDRRVIFRKELNYLEFRSFIINYLIIFDRIPMELNKR